MKYHKLGNSGLTVSALCLGMMSYGTDRWQPWVLNKSEGRRFVSQALDHGINYFDTADFYSFGQSEEALHEAIQGLCAREDIVISTKAGLPMGKSPNARGSSRKHIMEAVDASLKRLGTDYIDLYMIHVWDGSTPIEETVAALDDLVRAGKILYYGASNYLTWQLASSHYTARHHGGRGFSCMQLQYNLLYREEEREMLPFCDLEGIGVTVFSPLARGWLVNGDGSGRQLTEREQTRTHQDAKTRALYGSAADHAVRDRLLVVAERLGQPPGRVAMAWLHSKPQVNSVLVGALEPTHLDEAVASLEINLSEEDCQFLEEAYVTGPVKTDALDAVQKQSRA